MATVDHPQGPRRIGDVELPPIDQVGYVVKSLDETTQRHAALFGQPSNLFAEFQRARLPGAADQVHGFAERFGKRQDFACWLLAGADHDGVGLYDLCMDADFDVKPGVVNSLVGHISGHGRVAEFHFQQISPTPGLAKTGAEGRRRFPLKKVDLAGR